MKVREVIEINGWVNGSGRKYGQCYSDQIIDIDEDLLHEKMDWDWWETTEYDINESEDAELTVKFLEISDSDEDDEYDDEEKVIASHSIWIGDLAKERLTEEEAVARRIRLSDEWDNADCAELCKLADMDKEWEAADDDNFEEVVQKAADKLGVEIYNER